MSDHDIIELPWQPGVYGHRELVTALDKAGRPWTNSVLRLKAEQQKAWDSYQNGTGSPADDPNRPDVFPLAHVRGVAADIDPTPERVRRLTAAGLVRPYPYEPWHWQLPGNIRRYPLVTELPTPTTNALVPQEDTMALLIKFDLGVMPNDPTYLLTPGYLYCHEDAEEQRNDRGLYGRDIASLSKDDFYRALKTHGLRHLAGAWGTDPATWPLPAPGTDRR